VNWRLVWADVRYGRRTLALFLCSVALSITALVALGSLRANVDQSLLDQARGLIAADVQVRGTHPPGPLVMEHLRTLAAHSGSEVSRVVEFASMVSVPGHVLLCQIKAVPPSWPWYGTVALRSARTLGTVLKPGQAVVEASLLTRLHLSVGDAIKVGAETLHIADVVTQEPDQTRRFFAFGPHLLVAAADLPRLDLLRAGSHALYRTLVKTPSAAVSEHIVEVLRPWAQHDEASVETWQSAEGRLQGFFDRLLSFLSLTATFTMVLAGLGMQSTLLAWMAQQRGAMAIFKALGARQAFLRRHYSGLAGLLTVLGLALGTAVGLALQFAAPPDLLGPDVQVRWVFLPVLAAWATGAAVTGVFTLMPLSTVGEVRPVEIFQQRSAGRRPPMALLAVPVLAAVIWLQVQPARLAFQFTGGLLGVGLTMALLSAGLLSGLRRLSPRRLTVRLALRGIFRPGNQSWLLVTVLATALTVILALLTVEFNLQKEFSDTYPPDSPTLFFIDIQPDQLSAFQTRLGMAAPAYPVVPARVRAVNGRPVLPHAPGEWRRGDLDREVRLTWHDHALDSETVAGGGSIFPLPAATPQVSLTRELADEAGLRIGDRLTFTVSGVDVEAWVASTRELDESGVRPEFDYVLNPAALKEAPSTYFIALRPPDARLAELQNRMASSFPNVSSIDMHEVVKTILGRLEQLHAILSFFTAFSLVAGVLILVGALLSSEAERLQEAVYYKILGARRTFVVQVLLLEHCVLGGAAALAAVGISQAVGWTICRYWLDITYRPPLGGLSLVLILVPLALGGLSLWVGRKIWQERPAAWLGRVATG
jgi:putative ABC transport system permease protein